MKIRSGFFLALLALIPTLHATVGEPLRTGTPGALECEGTTAGDLVFGDLDGVVVVPRRVEQEVIAEALKKASGENLVRKEIENGMSSTAAFQKYGIL